MSGAHKGSLPKRVLIFCTHSGLAGAPIHVKHLVEGLGARFELRIVFGSEGEVSRELQDGGYKVDILPPCVSALNLWSDLRALVALDNILKSFRPDLIHVHSAKAGLLGRIAAWKNRIPHVYTVHGWGWRGKPFITRALVRLAEQGLMLIPRGQQIYVAEAVQQECAARLWKAERRGRVICNGVPDPGVSPIPEGMPTFLMAARVCDAKDHRTLVEAFDRLEGPARLILCGEGTDSGEFKNCIRSWAPRKNGDIALLGARGKILELMRSSHAVVLCSNYEAMPLVLLEGMAIGRPIVATRVGGNPEIVGSDGCGILLDPGDVEGWRQALQMLQDRGVCSAMGKSARARFEEKFTLSSMLEAVFNVYQQVGQS